MKKGLFFVIGGICLIVSIFLISYYSFQFFSDKQQKIDVSTIEISLSDEGKVNLIEQSPINDSESNLVEPYIFKVKNNGDKDITYQLLIEDYVSDANKKLLSRKNLNYSLMLGNDVIKSDNLSNVENNILDTRKLPSGAQNEYELRVWVTGDINSTEWMDKSYNYNVLVNPIID